MDIGAIGRATLEVTPADTALSLGSGDVEVLGTPALLALLERATVDAVAPSIDDDHTSVGISVEVHHLRAIAPGARVEATARVTAIDGPRVDFEVEAWSGSELVGRGAIGRAIVSSERFLRQVNPS